jgi:hypothetical protein
MHVNVENVIFRADYTLMTSTVPDKLRRLRLRADVSMPLMAGAMDLKGASSYQRYEDETLYKKPYLPLEKAEMLADYLVGKGTPPITRAEVLSLAGVKAQSGMDVEALEIALSAALNILDEAGYIEFSPTAPMSPAQIAGIVAHVCDQTLVQKGDDSPDAIRRGVLQALLKGGAPADA